MSYLEYEHNIQELLREFDKIYFDQNKGKDDIGGVRFIKIGEETFDIEGYLRYKLTILNSGQTV